MKSFSLGGGWGWGGVIVYIFNIRCKSVKISEEQTSNGKMENHTICKPNRPTERYAVKYSLLPPVEIRHVI